MVPPPVTPSPHRFVLSKKSRSTTIASIPQQPSPLHASSSIGTQKQQSSTTPQFNATPRFKLPGAPSQSLSQVPLQSIGHTGAYTGTNAHNAYSTPRRKSQIREEVIEDDDDMWIGDGDEEEHEGIVHDSIETVDWDPDDEMDIDVNFAVSHSHINNELYRPPRSAKNYPDPQTHSSRRKRRRISIASFSSSDSISNRNPKSNAAYISDEDANHDLDIRNNDPEDFEDLLSHGHDAAVIHSPPPPALNANQARRGSSHSRRASSSKPPHFILPSTPAPKSIPPSNDATATTPAAAILTRHRFLPPPTPAASEHAAEEQLPDAFSPHRRGRKYVPGGLAGEVAGWLVELSGHGNAGPNQLKDDRPSKEEDKIRVMEVGKGEGMLLIRGERQDERKRNGEEVQLVLIGRGEGASRGEEVRPGSVVRTRGRGWEVELEEGGRWRIWVRWEIAG